MTDWWMVALEVVVFVVVFVWIYRLMRSWLGTQAAWELEGIMQDGSPVERSGDGRRRVFVVGDSNEVYVVEYSKSEWDSGSKGKVVPHGKI